MTLPQLAGRSRGCNAASPTTQNREFAEEIDANGEPDHRRP
jgi:hypothetical protein